ncbi:MAG TPA: hypothetical protein VFF27_05795, partial [Bacteroidia bacterium]|nr:hypothetical protein [Bacteroidia bacterium]
MSFKKIKNGLTEKGFLLTLLFSVLCLFYFFGKLLQHPNHVFFGATADGLQGYYGALYHIKYDASYWRLDAMHYPYGDQVFFTACQPFLSDIIKFFNPFINLYDYTIGIINLVMLFSIVLSALFLYLIFKHLRLPYLYAAVAATAIAFLSPQLDRLGGHYSLTYQFAIPLFLLLLLKFYRSPSLKKSFFISFLVFFMMGTHFYIYAMLAILGVFYFGMLYVLKDNAFANIKFSIKHFFIQIVLPFIVIEVITICIDHVKDRTNFPYGFFAYKSKLAASLYRGGKFYNALIDSIYDVQLGEWEGQSFIGIVSVLFVFFMLFIFFKRIFSKQFKN